LSLVGVAGAESCSFLKHKLQLFNSVDSFGKFEGEIEILSAYNFIHRKIAGCSSWLQSSTEEIAGAQNFNSACKFFHNGKSFSLKSSIFGQNFFRQEIFFR